MNLIRQSINIARASALSLAIGIALASCASMDMGMGAHHVSLSGAEEVPPIMGSASGSGEITIADDGSVSGSVTASGFAPTAAHIHEGPAGKIGPVIVPFTKNGDTFSAPPGAKLTAAQMQAYKAGDLYVNIHSAAHPVGEVRAQLKP